MSDTNSRVNPQFERWLGTQKFNGLDTPLDARTRFLMQRAFEAKNDAHEGFCEKHNGSSSFDEVVECNDCEWRVNRGTT